MAKRLMSAGRLKLVDSVWFFRHSIIRKPLPRAFRCRVHVEETRRVLIAVDDDRDPKPILDHVRKRIQAADESAYGGQGNAHIGPQRVLRPKHERASADADW